MSNFDRRKLLQAGIVLAAPVVGFSLFTGCQQSNGNATDDNALDDTATEDKAANIDTPPGVEADQPVAKKPEQRRKDEVMKVQYLEIVTPEVDALCKQYSAIHEITFSEPDINLGNARTAKLNGGGLIGIRAPLRETETPVIRPYTLVDNLEEAVASAAAAGAQIALDKMEIPGHGTIAIVIQGGIECGLWQDLK